jgi:hypothetical protein
VPAYHKRARKNRRARALLDLLVLAALVFMLLKVLGPAMHAANIRADAQVVAAEAEKLYRAFDRYHQLHGSFPNAYLEPEFEVDTLEPLRRRGYYKGYVTIKLQDERIDAYGSPDDDGRNQEFWLEMTLKSDPRVRFLVARSDDAPLGGGVWRDGVFIYRNGELERL